VSQFAELTWGELTLACSPSRSTDGLLRGPPGAKGIPARTRPGQRTGSSGRTPGSSPDWRGVSRSAGSSNGSRRSRSQMAGGRLSGSSWRVLGWSSRWRWESRGSAGVWRTQKGQINRFRPGLHSLQWSQPGTAGLREYRPHNQGNSCRGNRDSEGPSKQRPRPGSCDQKSLGRGVTRRSGFGHPGPTPARYGLVWNPTSIRCTSLHFSLPVTTGASSASSQQLPFIRGDRSSSVASRFCWT
jgi:hypothetical protein